MASIKQPCDRVSCGVSVAMSISKKGWGDDDGGGG